MSYGMVGFTETFETLKELLEFVSDGGIDPSTKIIINGRETGEEVFDFIVM